MGRPFENNTETITTRVDPDTLAELEAASREDNINRSILVRDYVRAGLRARAARQARSARREAA